MTIKFVFVLPQISPISHNIINIVSHGGRQECAPSASVMCLWYCIRHGKDILCRHIGLEHMAGHENIAAVLGTRIFIIS